MRKFLRRSLYVLAGLLGFWSLVHGVEWIHGRVSMAAWIKERDALGGIPELASLVPPPIPDEENFAKAPIVEKILDSRNSPFRSVFKPPEWTEAMGRWSRGRPVDLDACAQANGVPDLLTLFAPIEGPLQELEQASRRQGFRTLKSVEEALLEPRTGIELLGFRSVLRILAFRSIARQKTGQSQAALSDVLTSLRTFRQVGAESDFGEWLTVRSLIGISMQAIWEGLNSRCWNSEQLLSLQREVESIDELQIFKSILAWERVRGERHFQEIYATRSPAGDKAQWERDRAHYRKLVDASKAPIDASEFDKHRPTILSTLLRDFALPQGWIVQNQIRQEQVRIRNFLGAVDPSTHRIHRSSLRAAPKWWRDGGKGPYTFLAAPISMEFYLQLFIWAARDQTYLDQAAVVCALERYRLDRREYPESLQALVPAYLRRVPPQVLTGEALGYARTAEGRFRLWAAAWEEQPDPASTPSKNPGPPRWEWPALQAAQTENPKSKIEN